MFKNDSNRNGSPMRHLLILAWLILLFMMTVGCQSNISNTQKITPESNCSPHCETATQISQKSSEVGTIQVRTMPTTTSVAPYPVTIVTEISGSVYRRGNLSGDPIDLARLLGNADCIAPCWQGISVIETETFDVLEALQQSELVEPTSIEEGVGFQSYSFTLIDGMGWGGVENNYHDVEAIGIELGNAQPVVAILQHLVPQYEQSDARLRSHRIIHPLCYQPEIVLPNDGISLFPYQCSPTEIDFGDVEQLSELINAETPIAWISYSEPFAFEELYGDEESVQINLADFTFRSRTEEATSITDSLNVDPSNSSSSNILNGDLMQQDNFLTAFDFLPAIYAQSDLLPILAVRGIPETNIWLDTEPSKSNHIIAWEVPDGTSFDAFYDRGELTDLNAYIENAPTILELIDFVDVEFMVGLTVRGDILVEPVIIVNDEVVNPPQEKPLNVFVNFVFVGEDWLIEHFYNLGRCGSVMLFKLEQEKANNFWYTIGESDAVERLQTVESANTIWTREEIVSTERLFELLDQEITKLCSE